MIYVQNVSERRRVKTGDYLGDVTGELEEFGVGSYIEAFVSVGPKNYEFYVFCPATGKRTIKSEEKGITLNYESSKAVNFSALRRMILEDDTPPHVHNRKKIKIKDGFFECLNRK